MDVVADILADPWPAERQVLAHAAAGTLCVLAPARPGADGPRVRAALLAHLICGGSGAAPVAAAGLRLQGAVIEGALALSFAEARGETDLRSCLFLEPVTMRRTLVRQLVLSGSLLPGLMAEGISVEGSVLLVGLQATGPVSLVHARIGGQLALNGAALVGLTAQGAEVAGSVYLRALGDAAFASLGPVSLSGARIGGQLACDGARFQAPGGIALNAQGATIAGDVYLRDQGALHFVAQGEVRFSGAQVAGQFDCTAAEFGHEGHALAGQRLRVGAEFFWQGVTVHQGDVWLPSAQVGDLVDDLASWPPGLTQLDGFTYDRITRDAPKDARMRVAWLARVMPQAGFQPQPWGQCARVLHAMGFEAEARAVMEAQARRKGVARRAAMPRVLAAFDWCWDLAARAVVGYGFAPFRALAWIGLLIGVSTWLAVMAWDEGSFAPANDLVAASESWQAMLAVDCLPLRARDCVANPAAVWNSADGPGIDWESFHPLAWGADLVVPVVELGQTRTWGPSRDRGPWGWALWWARWPLITLGWLVSALAAAAVTGIIQRSPAG